MAADIVIEPVIGIPKVTSGGDFAARSSTDSVFGTSTIEHTTATDLNNKVIAHQYFDQLKTEDGVQKIVNPMIALDEGGDCSGT